MKTKNNWITSNLEDRVKYGLPFDVNLKPYAFERVNFLTAAQNAAKDISKNYSNLYLSLSGGYDSEFILRFFISQHIQITPVIVRCLNDEETQYAFKACEELSINPIVINVAEREFYKVYLERILKITKGFSHSSTPTVIVADYVQENNGTLITGNHLLKDGTDLVSSQQFSGLNDHDFYSDITHPNLINIDFLLYNPQISYSAFPDRFDQTCHEYKRALYKLPYRNKIGPKFSREFLNSLNFIKCMPNNASYSKWWTYDEIDSIFSQHCNIKP